MRSISRFVDARPLWLAGLCVAAVLLAGQPPARLAAQKGDAAVPGTLERIPLDADVFAHLRVADVYGGPIVQDARKALGKEADGYQKIAEAFLGLSFDNVQAVSFCFPKMPMGPGDEQTFMVVVGTVNPYDKAKLLAVARKGEVKDSVVPLEGNMVLHLTSDRVFAVMHKSLVEEYAKGPARGKEGPLAGVIRQAAAGKNTFVGGVNLDSMPAEIRTAATQEPQVAPFKPLIEAQTLTGALDLVKDLKGEIRFQTKNGETAQDAERSWKLLMDLAARGLDDVLKDKRVQEEIGPLLPAVKELQNTVKNHVAKVDGSALVVSGSYAGNLPVAQMVKDALSRTRGAAARSTSQNNLRQLGLAMHNYESAYGNLPPAAIVDKKGKPMLSWRVLILPYIEQDALYREFKLDEPWDSEHNKKLIKKMPRTFLAPDMQKDDDTKTHYRLFHGNGAAFDLLQQTKLRDITDGTSNTIMMVEAAEAVEWTKPDDLEYDPMKDPTKLLRWVKDGTLVLFCDGSVRTLTRKVKEKTWHLLIQRADGNVVDPDADN